MELQQPAISKYDSPLAFCAPQNRISTTSTNAALQGDLHQFLCLNRELHRQRAEDFLAETVNDE